MWLRKKSFLAVTTCIFLQSVYACEMDGVSQWALPQTLEVVDTDRGIIFSRSTSNILGITSVTHFEGLNSGPYMDVTHTDSLFTIRTNEAYSSYEDNETLQSFSITVLFSCSGGSTNILVFLINIKDTNNNAPQFRPSEEYEFTIAPPVPPGFQITGCVNDIIVRDIDLTTQRIQFTIEENPYFEIAFDETSTQSKEFRAILRTTTLIRSLPEALELRITATDVDLTGDPPITTSALIRIQGDSEFELPEEPVFARPYYLANYTDGNQLDLIESITLQQGYDEQVKISLEGEYADSFRSLTNGNNVNIEVAIPLSLEALEAAPLLLVVRAERQDTSGATTTVVITVPSARQLGFESPIYIGMLLDSTLNVEPIVLNTGYDENVTFELSGEYAEYFTISIEENKVVLILKTLLPESILSENNFITLYLTASGFHAIEASTTIIIDTVKPDKAAPVFSEAYYRGVYTVGTGLTMEGNILITQGFDESVTFSLEGDFATWFTINPDGNGVSITLDAGIPEEVLQSNNHLLFTIVASKPDTADGRAAISIELPKDLQQPLVIRFTENSYRAKIENGIFESPVMTLEGESQLPFLLSLSGEYATFFRLIREQNNIIIEPLTLPDEIFNNNNLIVLEIEASYPEAVSGYTTIIFEIFKDSKIDALVFEQPYYIGEYSETDGLLFEHSIKIIEGFDETVEFGLESENSQWFELVVKGDSVELDLKLSNPIPSELLLNLWQLTFSVAARKPTGTMARAVVVISIIKDMQIENIEKFDKIIYKGIIRDGVVLHETITVSNYNGSIVAIIGNDAALFTITVSQGIVTIQGDLSVLPTTLSYLPLELRVADSSAVLLLDIVYTDNPEQPPPVKVEFSSSSYAVEIDISQTGLIGRVEAKADNGESIEYSLILDSDYLRQRLSIDSEGGLFLSAPADTGSYNFQVVAITIITQSLATAEVKLAVEATVNICNNDELVLPPLIIIDRDEEEAHRDLVLLNTTLFEGCQYTLSNRWPTDQTWLYVDEYGLHTMAIDREHESIAHMALSQVQVELNLECDNDNVATRVLSTRDKVWPRNLGPYDYGNSKWILTDAIAYNSRRSLVNLIVNDINDNYPIFDVKESEPIVVGYPISKLEEKILPRALIQLKATDADVGENAAIRYWSSEDVLAVSPLTGFVHVRDNSNLNNDALLTVHATDRNGEGLTTSLDLKVKLIDANHIAVLQVRDAFLDDEDTVLYDISQAVGYEVKALSSAVVSGTEPSAVSLKMKRDLSGATETSLQLYIYGLIGQRLVEVRRLTRDITNLVTTTTVNIARTESLEDYLDSLEICAIPGHDTALLVATITLSILLFILIVAVTVWMFLRWRKKQNYDQFSDENSFASSSESSGPVAKSENIPKPRLEIEELIRSERRLQEILDAPVETAASSTTLKKDIKPETKVVIPESHAPIVIQSFDKLKNAEESEDEDEYGERLKTKRKSVVTFNENVEKIILQDTQEEVSNPESEVYKF